MLALMPCTDLSNRLPGERRDPGPAGHWVATKGTWSLRKLCGMAGAVRLKEPNMVPAERPLRRAEERRVGGERGSWAPLWRGDRKEGAGKVALMQSPDHAKRAPA